jgi:transcriptional regulator with GAF, ATPase, and Fis domain
LLRVLQDRQVQRVGSTQPIQVDVRVIAATNQNLEDAVPAHKFRSDLYFRLSVFPIRIPPLRDRGDDIVSLAEYFVKYFAVRLRKPVTDIAAAVRRRLRDYDWPGNVRELQNVIERAVILASGPTIDLDAVGLSAKAHQLRQEPTSGVVMLAETERRAILAALDLAHWRVSGRGGAAERLGLKPTTLHAKMKKLGIRRQPDRDAQSVALGLRNTPSWPQ